MWVLGLWTVNPELRRLHDWYFGFSQVEIMSLLPLLSLFPYAWSLSVGGGWKRLHPSLAMIAWLWIGGFSYALLLAVLYGNILSGTYTFVDFILPIGLGLWIAADEAQMSISRPRIMRMLFGMTTVLSVYGIIQYIFMPPWDAFWLYSVNMQGAFSFGDPEPFQVRVFSMLNSPAPFAVFMAIMLLMSLPELSMRRPLLLAQVPIWLIAFGLSMDRSGWIFFAVGAVAYAFFTPRPGILVMTIAACTALLIGLMNFVPAVFGNDLFVTTINERLGSFSSLDRDDSAQQRQAQIGYALGEFLEAPLGRGLGVIGGNATKLSNGAAPIGLDNGYLSRLVEMGAPGSLLYGATFVLIFATLLKIWRTAKRIGDTMLQGVTGMTIAIECGILCFLLSGDVSGLPLLLFWLCICMVVGQGEMQFSTVIGMTSFERRLAR